MSTDRVIWDEVQWVIWGAVGSAHRGDRTAVSVLVNSLGEQDLRETVERLVHSVAVVMNHVPVPLARIQKTMGHMAIEARLEESR